jgi:type 1 glutamine amidotransferase
MTLMTPLVLMLGTPCLAKDWIVYEGKSGPGEGKHVVLVSGDEEYRSEEGLPMLAKILSQRHGFKCTVLFSVNEEGDIDPDNQRSLAGAETLDSADAIVMLLRFRNWPDATMKHFADAFERGVPIIGLRTSTHAFNYPGDRETSYRSYNGFGKQVLGERWVSHWGHHKKEATRGVIEPTAVKDPILRGIEDIFADSDVYEAYPPEDAKILVRGAVLNGMQPGDGLASYTKKRRSDSAEQDVNQPMMPVAWTRLHKQESGTENKIFCSTLGAATDLQNEGVRRMVVNAIYWGLGMDIPEKADVSYVDPFEPTMYGFNTFRRGLKPADHALGKVLPAGTDEPSQKAK